MERVNIFESATVTRRQFVDNYLSSLDARDRTGAAIITEQIADPTAPLAETLVLIPVAAHQEATHVYHTLGEYARQTTDQPFTVVLSLNHPSSEADNPGIAATLSELERARTDFPELDVRSAVIQYDDPAIGTIRRDLWNATLLQAYDEGAYQDNEQVEYIGINHDIDTVSMSPRYIARIQRYYQRRLQHLHSNGVSQLLPYVERSTLTRHALPGTHPNIARGVLWADYSVRARGVWYEAGIVLPFSHYAEHDGFPVGAKAHETAALWQNQLIDHAIPGTVMQTSPRRYIDRLAGGYGNIWSPGSFGASDACRTRLSRPDISDDHLEDIIEHSLDLTLQNIGHHAVDRYIMMLRITGKEETVSPDQIVPAAKNAVQRQLRLSEAVLRRAIRTDSLADRADTLRHDDKTLDAIISAHIAHPSHHE